MENIQTLEREHAGFWIRVLATLIDAIFFLIVIGGLLYAFIGFEPFIGSHGNSQATNIYQILHGSDLYTYIFINNILPLLIVITLWMTYRGTPGKLILGLEVVNRENGETLGIGRSFVRYFSYALSALPLGLGYIWVAIDKENRAFHDLIAGTVVLKKEQ